MEIRMLRDVRAALPLGLSDGVGALCCSRAAATAARRLERLKCFQPLALHGAGGRGGHLAFATRAIRGALHLRAKQLALQQGRDTVTTQRQ